MPQHHFEIHMAEKYGIEAAIFIDNFIFWTRTNAAAQKNFHEERYWCFGSPEFFQKYFPYMTIRKVKTILQNCVKEGVLVQGNYNKKKYDRTNWYSLSDEVLAELNLDKECSTTRINTHRTKIVDASNKNRLPIPDTKPDTKQINTTTTKDIDKKEEPSSSSGIISKEIDQQLLDARKGLTDERDDEEFLKQCKHHLDTSEKAGYCLTRALSGLHKIIRKGFETPPDYKKEQNAKKNGGFSDEVLYSNYIHDTRTDIKFGIKPQDTKILSFEEWKQHRE
ncbi:MAG: hypothetical protein K0U12_01905 [Gammaproteobacteria bacterium]|nr:hypothetical protein [Gammaproteobacteria bacterium]